MSNVTNIVLNLGLGNEDRLADVNRFFDGIGQRGFVSVENELLPHGWYGGARYLEMELALGAFNHISLEDLVAHIRGLNLDCPEEVQLLVCGQEEERFHIVDIEPEVNP